MSKGIKPVSESFAFSEFLDYIGHVTGAEDFYRKVSEQRKDELKHIYDELSVVDLNEFSLDESVMRKLSEAVSRDNKALMLRQDLAGTLVGFVNPTDAVAIQNVSDALQQVVIPVLMHSDQFKAFFSRIYTKYDLIKKRIALMPLEKNVTTASAAVGPSAGNAIADIFKLILQEAVQFGASDIHVESFEKKLRVRFRVDGLLREYAFDRLGVADYLVRYIKILANIDIAEEKIPTDGRHVTLVVEGQSLNIRVSVLPTHAGNSAVIRILGDDQKFDLQAVIPDQYYYDQVRNYLDKKQGMLIISGPTGSGKTTTLFSAVRAINSSERKIITVEDPVEVSIPGVNQVQVDSRIGYDFASALRSILRQDPDVILIGEIRDEETAQAGIRASITGHMVLASTHTRSVQDIPIRFIDFGADPFSLSSALRLMISQRLIRRLCGQCREEHMLTSEEKERLRELFPWVDFASGTIYKAKGCSICGGSGYVGRTIIYELLQLTPEMIRALSKADIRAYSKEADIYLEGKRLADNAMRTVLAGQTSLDELFSYMD